MVMKNQVNLPVFPDDHRAFKIEATAKGISMKELFHIVVESRKANPHSNFLIIGEEQL